VLAPNPISNPLHVSFPFPSHCCGKQHGFAREHFGPVTTPELRLAAAPYDFDWGGEKNSLTFENTAAQRLLVGVARVSKYLPSPAKGP
jgi:hypothetical protein